MMMNPDEKALARSELAPQGLLRVGLNVANFLLVQIINPQTIQGVAPDLSRAIAQDLGVDLEFVPYNTPGDLAAACNSQAWRMALFAVEPDRAQDMDFSAGYLEIDACYLVSANSGIHGVGDVDRSDVRIAVMQKSAYELYLSRTLKQAHLVQTPDMDASFEAFVRDGLEALAGLRPRLTLDQQKIPGARLLQDRFTAVQQAVAVPKGNPAAAAYVRQYVEMAKSSGLVAELIFKHRVQGVQVAPLAGA
jgi:polar amino acid transport system substrate-binding protein